jgi:hypothetical protein
MILEGKVSWVKVSWVVSMRVWEHQIPFYNVLTYLIKGLGYWSNWILNNVFTKKKSFKSELKCIRELGFTVNIVGKPLMNKI